MELFTTFTVSLLFHSLIILICLPVDLCAILSDNLSHIPQFCFMPIFMFDCQPLLLFITISSSIFVSLSNSLPIHLSIDLSAHPINFSLPPSLLFCSMYISFHTHNLCIKNSRTKLISHFRGIMRTRACQETVVTFIEGNWQNKSIFTTGWESFP